VTEAAQATAQVASQTNVGGSTNEDGSWVTASNHSTLKAVSRRSKTLQSRSSSFLLSISLCVCFGMQRRPSEKKHKKKAVS
jgi:hypothetical protein